ncbi:MAG: hypothetical protein ACFFG0_01790 [Candidatus Thorarchaeota archaeon]
MKYFIRGKNEVILNQNNFVSKGGEGSIFRKGKISYKIYNDPKKMIPEAKIKELQVIKKDNVIKPKDIILNKRNTIVGFTMDWKDGFPLCKLFTTDFRKRMGVTEDTVTQLVENIKLTINEIHKAKCLIVDGNEFNYLTDNKDLTIPYFIDVNSYKTPSFPATAIMPSIRDWHSKVFTELSDWFSFAIIACQLFVGIHPFKGRHPKYKKNDLETRMKSNVSIFNSKVRVPAPTRDFNLIPSKYKEWFIDLFENGKRIVPPELPGTITLIPVVVKLIKSTNTFEIEFLREVDGEIYFNSTIFGNEIIKSKEKIYIGKVDYKVSQGTEILFTQKYSTPMLVKIDQEKLKMKSLDNNKKIYMPDLKCQDLMIINNVLYLKNNGSLLELNFNERQERITVALKNSWNIMANSSIIFSGLVYQSVLGKPYLVIPIPKVDGLSSCIVKNIPELEEYKVIEAKHDSGVCVLTVYKDGIYNRIVLKFDETYDKYSYRLIKDISDYSINFVTLDNDVVVMMNDDLIEIFSKDINKEKVHAIDDPDIDSTMKLCKSGTEVRFFKGNKLYKIKMRK